MCTRVLEMFYREEDLRILDNLENQNIASRNYHLIVLKFLSLDEKTLSYTRALKNVNDGKMMKY